MADAKDIYGSGGSVPDAVAVDGSGAGYRQLHATPDDFGAQTGKAIENFGDKGQELAVHYLGLMNETKMTNADAQLAMQVGKIKGDYMSKTGQAAYDSFPQYQQDLENARQSIRSTLPPAAAHGFDMLSMRSVANHIADGSGYAASQIKQANREAGTSLSNVNVQAILDPQIAADPERVDYHVGSAIHGLQMSLDEHAPGMKVDGESGTVDFDTDTVAGRAAKANYDASVDDIITKAQVNRFTTLANGDLFGAHSTYEQEKDGLPKAAQVHLDAWFDPKLFNARVDGGTTEVLAHAEQQHASLLYNPPGSLGRAVDTVLKNEGGLSPDGHALYGIDRRSHPDEFAKAQEITDKDGVEAGQKYARNFYKTEYYDKKGIGNLPANTRDIVLDGVVNHYTEFGNKLIDLAKNGASPQDLIDARREEYARLNTTGKPEYTSNFQGWNNRLDSLQRNIEQGDGTRQKSYGTNENGGPLTQADYFRSHSQDVIDRADALSQRDMPGDLAYKHAMRETVTNFMNKTIANESAQYKQDNETISRAIVGQLTKGNPPMTREELEAIPGIKPVLDRVQYQDPKFASGIDVQIAKIAQRNSVDNSRNGYEVVMRSLETGANQANRISSEEHLHRLLGRTDETGINAKDYSDAKMAVGASDDWKKFLSKNMTQITNANGNIDGKGQERAMGWYRQVNDAKKKNDLAGDKGVKEGEFIKNIDSKLHPLAPPAPSRMQQISNWMSEKIHGKPEIPTLSTKAQFDKLSPGSIYIRDGQKYRKP